MILSVGRFCDTSGVVGVAFDLFGGGNRLAKATTAPAVTRAGFNKTIHFLGSLDETKALGNNDREDGLVERSKLCSRHFVITLSMYSVFGWACQLSTIFLNYFTSPRNASILSCCAAAQRLI